MVVKRGKAWMVDFWFEDPDGRRQRVRKRSPVQSRKGAEEYERQLREAMLGGIRRKRESITLASFRDDYLAYCRVNNKPSLIVNKKSYLKKLIKIIGTRDLGSISFNELETLKKTLLEEGRSHKTINNYLSTLRHILNVAKKKGLITNIPEFHLLKEPPQNIEFLDFPDYLTLHSSLEGQARLLVLLGGDAGLRRGELAGLQWTDINWTSQSVTIRRSIWGPETVSPKGGRARTIPLTKRLLEALRHQKKASTPDVVGGAAKPALIYCLCLKDGSPWNDKTFRWRMPKIYKQAGLAVPSRPVHCLRHTFCSHLAMKGVAPRVIQELAGHSTIQTTMRYMHFAPRLLESAVSLLEEDMVNIWSLQGRPALHQTEKESKNNAEVLGGLVPLAGFKPDVDGVSKQNQEEKGKGK